jgi:hypothetical protein
MTNHSSIPDLAGSSDAEIADARSIAKTPMEI